MKRPTFGSKVSNNFLSNNFLTNKLLTFSLKVLNLYSDWHWRKHWHCLAVRMASLPLGGAGGGLEQEGGFPPLLILNFSFDFPELFLRLNSTFPSIFLKCRALNENIASARHRNAEPSLSKRRALGN